MVEMLEDLGGLEIPDESGGSKRRKQGMKRVRMISMLENTSNILFGSWSGFDNMMQKKKKVTKE